jgi:hypothetical protein
MDADRLQNASRYLRENAEIITTVCVVLAVALGTALYLLTRAPSLPDPVYRPVVEQPAAAGPSEDSPEAPMNGTNAPVPTSDDAPASDDASPSDASAPNVSTGEGPVSR